MRLYHPTLHGFECPVALLALGIILCWISPVFAQPAAVDPVEGIRLVLRGPVSDPAQRSRALVERIQALEGLGDLRRALVLREWRDEDQDQRVATVDRPSRLALARRFEQALRDVLRQGDDASRLAVLSMLAEMGTTTRGVGTRHGIARCYGPDLVELIKHGEAGVCAVALRTLGQIDPEPDVALDAFSDLLSSGDANQRLAAAHGLLCWIRTLAQLATRASHPGGVEVSRVEFVAVGRAIVPLAARGLAAEQPEIRRHSARAIGSAATALREWVLAACSSKAIEDWNRLERPGKEQIAALLPLIVALKEQRPVLMHALVDTDSEVRFLVGFALEDMTFPPEMLSQDAPRRVAEEEKIASAVIVRPSSFLPTSSHDDRQEVYGAVQALAALLNHADVQARRAALETLEALGPEAAAATPELIGALRDPDKFVRWAAARTLGRICSEGDDDVALGLARLLADADLDVRLAAAAALERSGPAGKTAVPDLCRTVGSTDAELRVAAIRALQAIGGPDAHASIPEVAAALTDADARVRQVAVQALGMFGPSARQAVPALCPALQDDSPDVRQAAGEALLNILRPGKK